MSRTFFELEDDLYLDGRWHLAYLLDGAGAELDARDFTYGVPIRTGPPLRVSAWNSKKIVRARPPLQLLLHTEGIPLDFTFTADDMPVVTSKVAQVLAAVAGTDIQRIPVTVESQSGGYEIINVISRVDCIDPDRSEIQWFEEGNDIRPDLAGKPEMITKLVIDPARAAGHNIFRPEGWEGVIVVSDLVKRALERARVTGVSFRRV